MENFIDITSLSAGILSITEFTKKYVPVEHRELVLPIISILAGIGISVYIEINNGTITGGLSLFGSVLAGAFAGVTVSGSYRAAKGFNKKGEQSVPLSQSDV